jgi:hypothetical protein
VKMSWGSCGAKRTEEWKVIKNVCLISVSFWNGFCFQWDF